MFGKLIKYEMKALIRYLVPFCVVMLILMGLFAVGVSSKNELLVMPVALIPMISIVWIFIGGLMIVYTRVSSGLFGDESYLIHTTPASPSKIIFSKLVSHVVLISIYMAVTVIIGVGVMFVYMDKIEAVNFSMLSSRIHMFINVDFWINLIQLLLGVVLMIANYILIIYLSTAISNLRIFSSCKKLVCIIAFFLIPAVFGYIESKIGLGFSMFSLIFESRSDGVNMTTNMGSMVNGVYLYMLKYNIISLVESTIFFVGVQYIISKKLNLE